jgi:hypothetical protein
MDEIYACGITVTTKIKKCFYDAAIEIAHRLIGEW